MTIPSPRARLDELGRALPTLWRAVETIRQQWRPGRCDWPSRVFLPLEAAGAATLTAIRASGGDPCGPAELSSAACTTQCLATWRMTQGIYRIDPTLYAALIATPVDGEVPSDVLLYLPEWCVYIETPGMRAPTADGGGIDVCGLWYWLDADPAGKMTLCIGLDAGLRPPLIVQHVPLVGTLEQAIAATLDEWQDAYARGNATRLPPTGYAAAARAFLPPALSLVLYLCSRAAEIRGPSAADRPGNPTPVATRRQGARLHAAPGPREWVVGAMLGSALRRALAQDVTPGARGVRPHIRRAHWHTFLLGSRREGDPTRDLRWMPPIPVALDDFADLPPTIHPVRER